MQRLIITVMAILLLMSINSFAKPVGKILELSGDIDITSMKTGKRIIPEEGTVICFYCIE